MAVYMALASKIPLGGSLYKKSRAFCPGPWVSFFPHFHPYIYKSHIILVTYITISFTFIICQCHAYVRKSLPFRPSMIQLVFDRSLNTIHSFIHSTLGIHSFKLD